MRSQVLAWGVCACNIAGAVLAKIGSAGTYITSGPYAGYPDTGLTIAFGQVS